MNIPAYQKKDYSYLQNAFQPAQQGFGQMTKGISSAIDIGDKLRKRKQEEDLLADLKIQRKDAEKVRETAIVEYAAQIHEAMGLPDTEEGYGRAQDLAAQEIYPFYGDEKQDPAKGVKRLYTDEQKREQRLNTLKMKRFREEFQKGTVEEQFPQRQSIQEPVGSVGVEENQGTVKKPLSAFPQSVAETQQQADREMIEQPQIQPTVTRERTADDFYRLGVEYGITDQPEFKSLMSTLSRQDIVKRERDKPLTQQQYATEALAQPVVPTNELVGKLPSEMSEAEKEKLKVERLKALRPRAGKDPISTEIREETKRYDKIRSEILKYNEKINRLRQARVRLEGGKKLDDEIKKLLVGITDPENPNVNEINGRIEDLQILTDDLNNDIKTINDRLASLGRGKSIADIVKAEAQKKIDMNKEANIHIINEIKPVSSQFTTTAQILNMLPPMYKKIIKERVAEFKGRGVRDKRIVDWLLGRK
jgi:hypothetical protein